MKKTNNLKGENKMEYKNHLIKPADNFNKDFLIYKLINGNQRFVKGVSSIEKAKIFIDEKTINLRGEKMNIKQTRKIIKVLIKKTVGLNRLEKVKEMQRGLNILNLMVCRQKRDRGISGISFEAIDHIDKILQQSITKREKA